MHTSPYGEMRNESETNDEKKDKKEKKPTINAYRAYSIKYMHFFIQPKICLKKEKN